MRRRLPLNLTLAALAAGLIAVLVLDRPPEDAAAPITGLERDAIDRVTIHYPDAKSIRLTRGDRGWRLKAPVSARAEASSVAQILRLAGFESRQAMPANEVKPADIGLEPPQQTVVVNDTRIELGAVQPIDNRRYARVGDTVHLIDEPNMRALDADYADLVARRLLPEDAEITGIELPGATLTPTDQGGWSVTPDSADRGADAAQTAVDAWKRTEALSVKSAEAAGDGEVSGRAVVTTAEHGELVFEVLQRQPQLLLRRPDLGVVFHVAGNQAAPLLDMTPPEPGQPGAAQKLQQRLKQKPDVQLSPGGGQ